MGFSYYNIVDYETKINQLANQPITEVKYSPSKKDVQISKFAQIISRDGDIPKKNAIQYAKWIHESSSKYGVDPVLVLSVMKTESNFDPSAKSGKQAIGLMQVIAKFHPEKVNPAELKNPKKNIEVGTQILREYRDISRSDTEALLRYNGSLGKKSSYAKKVLTKRYEYERQLKFLTA